MIMRMYLLYDTGKELWISNCCEYEASEEIELNCGWNYEDEAYKVLKRIASLNFFDERWSERQKRERILYWGFEIKN